jgi:hypothetical protein
MLEGGIVEQYKSWFYSYRICASILYLDYYITQPVYSTWKQLDSTVFRCHFIYFIIFFSNKTLLVDIWFFIYLLSMAKYIVQIQTLFLVYVIVGCWRISWYVIFAFRALNIIKYLLLLHILLQSVHFCMSTESVLIIFPPYLPWNIRICLRIQLPVSVAVVSKIICQSTRKYGAL